MNVCLFSWATTLAMFVTLGVGVNVGVGVGVGVAMSTINLSEAFDKK